MELPNYPNDYFDFANGVNVSNEDINNWVKEIVEILETDDRCNGLGRSAGNAYVRVDRDECGKYRVFVTKNYQEKTIY